MKTENRGTSICCELYKLHLPLSLLCAPFSSSILVPIGLPLFTLVGIYLYIYAYILVCSGFGYCLVTPELSEKEIQKITRKRQYESGNISKEISVLGKLSAAVAL